MNIRPIGKNEISFITKKSMPKKSEKSENTTEMIHEPEKEDPHFPRKWTNIIIITKGNEGEDGEETEGLDRK